MALDVETPDPPQLTNRGSPEEFDSVETVGSTAELRRAELESILQAGAWHEAFAEWASYTDLSEPEYRLLLDLGLIQQLDVFWDPTTERLWFDAPSLPDDWTDRVETMPVDATGLAGKVEGELTDLGETLVEMLVDEYLDWGDAETEDVFWSEETFGHGIQE